MPGKIIVTFAALLTCGTVLADTCGDYPLTQDQSDALQEAGLDVVIPEGDVPFVQRCDIDGNEIIDIFDVRQIVQNRNQKATDPDDPMDWNQDGRIDGLDARGCVVACTYPRCASSGRTVSREAVVPTQTNAQSSVGESGECFQADDFTGDGKQDLVGIYQYVGNQTRGNNWNLQTVLFHEDAAGNTRVTTFPYSGQSRRDGGEIFQHLSPQPAGPVDLMPGGVILARPGVVSYRNNEPKVLYYFQNGRWNRAFYRVDD